MIHSRTGDRVFSEEFDSARRRFFAPMPFDTDAEIRVYVEGNALRIRGDGVLTLQPGKAEQSEHPLALDQGFSGRTS